MKHRLLLDCRWTATLALLVLLGGCAVPVQTTTDPALFPRSATAPASKFAGRVALLVPPQVAGTLAQSEQFGGPRPQLPIGRIVEQAALLALGDAVSGGVDSLDAAPAANAGYSATLVIESVRCVHRVHVLWIAPIPYLGLVGDSQTDVQVTFELRLLDAQGRTAWTQAYDSGREVWKHPMLRSKESQTEGIVRLAHEGSWRL